MTPARTKAIWIIVGSLIVVVVAAVFFIVPVIFGTAIWFMSGNLAIAQNTAVNTDVKSIETDLLVYKAMIGHAPSTEEGLEALVTRPASLPASSNWKKLLDKIPTDPWGRLYVYRRPGKHNRDGYDVFSLGKDGVESADDIGNWK